MSNPFDLTAVRRRLAIVGFLACWSAVAWGQQPTPFSSDPVFSGRGLAAPEQQTLNGPANTSEASSRRLEPLPFSSPPRPFDNAASDPAVPPPPRLPLYPETQTPTAADTLRATPSPLATPAFPAVQPPTNAGPAEISSSRPADTQGNPTDARAKVKAPTADAPPQVADELSGNLAKHAETAKDTLTQAVLENNRQAQLALARDYLLPIVVILLVMLAANWFGSTLRNQVTEFVSRRVDVTLGRFAGTLTKVATVLCAMLGVLSYFSVEMTSLAAVIAAVGFAIGMALQGTLGNFASGIALLVFRPFNVGDYIVIDGTVGMVQAIDLFTTAIDTPDNRRVIVPNDSVFGHKIENWTHNATRRVEVSVGVSYAADMKQTRCALEEAITHVPGALSSPAPSVYLQRLNTSSVDWSCRVWCRTPDYRQIQEQLTEAVKENLDRHGIGIPFPQLDLHVVTPPRTQRRSAA